MMTRKLWLLAAVGVVALVPALALGRTATKSHTVNLTAQFDTITSTGTVGTPGTVDRDAGIVTGKIAGSPDRSGALTQTVTWGSGLTFTGKGITYSVHGTTSYKVNGKVTLSGGKQLLSGTLKITGGTGLYKHAAGMLSFSGSAPIGSDTDAATAKLTGKIKY